MIDQQMYVREKIREYERQIPRYAPGPPRKRSWLAAARALLARLHHPHRPRRPVAQLDAELRDYP